MYVPKEDRKAGTREMLWVFQETMAANNVNYFVVIRGNLNDRVRNITQNVIKLVSQFTKDHYKL